MLKLLYLTGLINCIEDFKKTRKKFPLLLTAALMLLATLLDLQELDLLSVIKAEFRKTWIHEIWMFSFINWFLYFYRVDRAKNCSINIRTFLWTTFMPTNINFTRFESFAKNKTVFWLQFFLPTEPTWLFMGSNQKSIRVFWCCISSFFEFCWNLLKS